MMIFWNETEKCILLINNDNMHGIEVRHIMMPMLILVVLFFFFNKKRCLLKLAVAKVENSIWKFFWYFTKLFFILEMNN